MIDSALAHRRIRHFRQFFQRDIRILHSHLRDDPKFIRKIPNPYFFIDEPDIFHMPSRRVHRFVQICAFAVDDAVGRISQPFDDPYILIFQQLTVSADDIHKIYDMITLFQIDDMVFPPR